MVVSLEFRLTVRFSPRQGAISGPDYKAGVPLGCLRPPHLAVSPHLGLGDFSRGPFCCTWKAMVRISQFIQGPNPECSPLLLSLLGFESLRAWRKRLKALISGAKPALKAKEQV